MDWAASGISNSFELRPVSFDLQVEGDPIDIVGGKLTKNIDADYRESLTCNLNLTDELSMGSMYRAYHTAKLGAETVRTCLGTYYLQRQGITIADGANAISAQLQSALLALGTDHRGSTRVVRKGTNVKAHFESIVTNAHAVPQFSVPNQDGRAFSSDVCWEYGESVLTQAHRCADAVGGIVMPGTWGHCCIVPYVAPEKREVVARVTSDVRLDSMSVESPDIVNRVHVSYTYDSNGEQRTLYSTATVAASHPWHHSRIGRNSSEALTVDDLSANTQSALDAEAAARLSAASSTGRKYQLTMLYTPAIRSGDAVVFEIGDSARMCIVSQMEISLDSSMLMSMTIEEVS